MKKAYNKPVLARRAVLPMVTADNGSAPPSPPVQM
jgi:hypothetical protein